MIPGRLRYDRQLLLHGRWWRRLAARHPQPRRGWTTRWRSECQTARNVRPGAASDDFRGRLGGWRGSTRSRQSSGQRKVSLERSKSRTGGSDVCRTFDSATASLLVSRSSEWVSQCHFRWSATSGWSSSSLLEVEARWCRCRLRTKCCASEPRIKILSKRPDFYSPQVLSFRGRVMLDAPVAIWTSATLSHDRIWKGDCWELLVLLVGTDITK